MRTFLQFAPSFKSEIAQRSLPAESTTAVFDEKGEKLLRLGLDPAAHEGEISNCAVALFRSWRARGIGAERVIQALAQSTWHKREIMAARGRIMPFELLQKQDHRRTSEKLSRMAGDGLHQRSIQFETSSQ